MSVMKMAVVSVGIAVLLGGVATAGSAYIGGNAGVGAANEHVEEGLAAQGYLELDAGNILALRGTALYFAGDTKVDILSDGEFSMFGIECSLILKAPSQGIIPYVGFGPGYYLPENDLSSDFDEAYLATFGTRGKEDLQPGVGFHGMAGVAIEIAKNVSIDLNLKYVYFKTDDEFTATNVYNLRSATVTEEVDLSTLFVTGGLRIAF